MKIKILGTLMLLSVLVCGGGVDTGSAVQTVVGLVMFILMVWLMGRFIFGFWGGESSASEAEVVSSRNSK